MTDFNELIQKLIDAAINLCSDYEWMEDMSNAEVGLEEAKNKLREAITVSLESLDLENKWYQEQRDKDNLLISIIEQENNKLEEDNKLLRGAMFADDERLHQATEKVGLPNFGCDNADVLADEIEGGRMLNKELKLQLEVMTNASDKRWEEIEKLKSINHNILEQLDIATDLGEKRFQEVQKLQKQLEAEHLKFMDSQTEILFARLAEKKNDNKG